MMDEICQMLTKNSLFIANFAVVAGSYAFCFLTDDKDMNDDEGEGEDKGEGEGQGVRGRGRE